jgi:four helix bundle protein
MSHSYRDLIACQKAKRLAVSVYKCTESFPRCEMYGLTAQSRRAAVSIASNIAEGQGRLTPGEFTQFLGHSRGSLLELEAQLSIAFELRLLGERDYGSLTQECYQVLGLLNRLIESLRNSKRPPRGVTSAEASKRETLKL